MRAERKFAMQLGVPELLIVLLIVIVLFGVGRIGRIGADLGTAVREFRKGLQSDEDKKPDDKPADKS
jgi:sec-independent protein translocase protein TatA